MNEEDKDKKAEAVLTIEPEIVREAKEAEAKEANPEGPSLQEVIEKQATEDDAAIISGGLSLRKILGGDILTTSTIRHQIWLFLLIGFFLIIYTRSSGSQLTEMSRQSNVMDMLKNNKDSMLHIASEPPYKIKVPE